MHTYSIAEARKIALNRAKQYDKNLNSKSYIIIYREHTSNSIRSIEVQFDANNYQHLTGIEMIDSDGTTLLKLRAFTPLSLFCLKISKSLQLTNHRFLPFSQGKI